MGKTRGPAGVDAAEAETLGAAELEDDNGGVLPKDAGKRRGPAGVDGGELEASVVGVENGAVAVCSCAMAAGCREEPGEERAAVATEPVAAAGDDGGVAATSPAPKDDAGAGEVAGGAGGCDPRRRRSPAAGRITGDGSRRSCSLGGEVLVSLKGKNFSSK